MTITREMLSAYVDDELATDQRARIEAALKGDESMRSYVERQRLLKKGLAEAYAPILDEPVPHALAARILASVPAPRRQGAPLLQRLIESVNAKTDWLWLAPAGAVAAAVVFAVMVGFNTTGNNLVIAKNGGLEASPRLAAVLTDQLASDAGAAKSSGVHIGLSFAASNGELCRTFGGNDAERGDVAGIACRGSDAWRVAVLAKADPSPADELYRPAGSALPAIIREAVGDMISGDPFDAAAEQRAKDGGWRR